MQKTRETVRNMDKFSQAVNKIASASASYRDSQIKHIDYASQCDAAIEASGWLPEDFHKEIQERRHKLGI